MAELWMNLTWQQAFALVLCAPFAMSVVVFVAFIIILIVGLFELLFK